jgi:hypothetical protein
MFKPTFDDADQFDPVLATSYAVAFPDFPLLGYLAADADLPGWTVDRVRAELFGRSREWPGRCVSSHTLTMTMLYDDRSRAFRSLYSMLQSVVDNSTGNRSGQLFTIIVEQYDSMGLLVQQRLFDGCWVADLRGYQVSASSRDTAVMIPVEFGYTQQFVTFGGKAISAPLIPTNATTLLGSDPRDLLETFSQSLLNVPDSIVDILRTGSQAVAYGKAILGAANQLSSVAKNVVQQAKTNPIAAAKSASSLIKQTKSTLKSFF